MSARPRGAAFGKPDATGRSSGRLSRAELKLLGPPNGVPWAWQPTELLASAAWRGASIHCRKLIDFLMIEHGNHAGRENGNLGATYDQLKAFGISRPRIKPAIAEAVARGLVEVTVAGGLHGVDAKRTLSRYRLTWTGCLNPGKEPTNEWRSFVEKHFTGAPRTAPEEQNRVHPVLHPTKIDHEENRGFPTSRSGVPRTAQPSRYLEGAERINAGRRLAGVVVKAMAARDAYLALWCWVVVVHSHAQERRPALIAPASPAEGAS